MFSRVTTALAIVLTASGGAHATGAIDCTDPEGRASLELTLGSVPVLAVVRAVISADERQWITATEGENAIAVGQAFRSDDEIRIDFTDLNVERIVAEVRLFSADEGRDHATAGVLRIADVGVYPLVCIGP
ncbi:hypothetical protein GCM10023174_07290 [Chelativorans composti]|mgnify:CR=1 FL=1|jgi:hypothetical protein|uniref:Uncharacterized protein n=1 Tax=Chelativorans composti TaxID=768533 RepID=A0ABW5DKN2_9HYPH